MTHIADEAVEAALDSLMDDGHNGIQCAPDRNLKDSVRVALTVALPHLEGAAPSRDTVVEALWNVRGMGPNTHRNHGYDAFCPVCMSDPYRIADALVAAGLIGGAK